MPPDGRGRPGKNTETADRQPMSRATAESIPPRPQCVSSQQVSWWTVREFVAPVLARMRSWPTVGTPQWCALDDADPVKIAALFDAAQHWALRVETCQQAHCEASREISDAADWSAIAWEALVRRAFYEHRPWMRRVVS